MYQMLMQTNRTRRVHQGQNIFRALQQILKFVPLNMYEK